MAIRIIIILTMLIISLTANAEVKYLDVYPVFINHCAGCHNATTPERNWLDETMAISKRDVIFNRVFVKGDMPLYFRFFGGEEKRILKMWLEQTEVR